MGDINSLYEAYTANNKIDPKYYEKFNVKRGLRNPDGSGVMAGVTNICNVHGYVINEGEKSPDEGKLVSEATTLMTWFQMLLPRTVSATRR